MFFLILIAGCLGAVSGKCQGGTITDTGLSCEQKQLIVDIHNKLRNQVAAGEEPTQPNAANMLEMGWCDDVADTAQDWANHCVFEHNVDKKIDGQRLGQNLAIKWGTHFRFQSSDLEGMLYDWYNEVKEHGYNGTFSYDSGHYSQMIWGSSYCVGCGLSLYKKGGFNYSYLVCNYLPAGNVIGSAPYDEGEVDCENYGLDNSTLYSNLCAMDTKKAQACDNEIENISEPKTTNEVEDTPANKTKSQTEASVTPDVKKQKELHIQREKLINILSILGII